MPPTCWRLREDLMAVIVNNNEIVLIGTVGPLYWDDSFGAGDVIIALAQIGHEQDVTIRLNSGGGIATEGAAIHAALARHAGQVTIVVEGIAASAASLIAMAGDEIVMAAGSLMMIHEPAGLTFGTRSDHELTIRSLDAMISAYSRVYADKSGRSDAEVRADMASELWLTGDAAVQLGYADRVAGSAADGTPSDITAFDYRLYSKAPDRLVALARDRGWGVTSSMAAMSAATRQKENIMATEPADKASAIPTQNPQPSAAPAMEAGAVRSQERERIQAIMSSDAAKGREDLARHLALATDTSPEVADAIMKAAPGSAPSVAEPNRFDAAMRAAGNPAVGPDGGAIDPDDPSIAAAAIVAAYRGSTGKGI